MEQNVPQFYDRLTKHDIESCFRLRTVQEELPIQIVSTGLKDILLPIDAPTVLKNMIPDFERISITCVWIETKAIYI